MAFSLYTAKLALTVCFGAAIWGIWVLALTNGTLEQLGALVAANVLPGTKEPVLTRFFGIKPLDAVLLNLAPFFWEQIDGSHPSASLAFFEFGTQFMVVYGLIMLEASRVGNKKRWWLRTAVLWGCLCQGVGVGVIMPIYALVHLSTSPLALSPSFTDAAPYVLGIPFSIVFGYVLPGVFMALPFPKYVSYETHQFWVAAWQPFPVWAGLLQFAVTSLVQATLGKSTGKRSAGKYDQALGETYTFLKYFSVFAHVTTIGIILAATLYPNMFAPGLAEQFNYIKVFVPSTVMPGQQVNQAAEGATLFLQWDRVTAMSAAVIWSATLLVQVQKRVGVPDRGVPLFVLDLLFRIACYGPAGAAVTLLQDRDTLLEIAGAGVERKKN